MSHETNRREFLKTGLITTAAIVTSGTLDFLKPMESWAQESFPHLVISHGTDPGKMTRAAVDAMGGIKRFVKPGNKVVIKPNMSFASGPNAASNTNPAVVSEVARMCSEAGAARISILDNVLHEPHDCLAQSKIPEKCEGIPNASVNVLKAKRLFTPVNVPNGKILTSMEIASEVAGADVLIAVPVGKSHASSSVSLSMKGMMGLIYDRNTLHSRGLHEGIVDMVSILKPQLVIIDGTRILSSGGPSGPGKVIPLNLVIASTDMVAADAQMVALGTWYGKQFQPAQVRHIRLAAERGLGRMDLDKLNIRNITV
jgi:uncharacterized protein (DUF362 family)